MPLLHVGYGSWELPRPRHNKQNIQKVKEFKKEIVSRLLFDVIRFVLLEHYSPETNPVDPLWDRVKDRLANEIWENLDEMESAITEVLKPFWEDVKNVWSFFGNTWLTRGIIMFLQQRLE